MTFLLILISRIVGRVWHLEVRGLIHPIRSLFWLFPYNDVVFFSKMLTSAEIVFATAMGLEDSVRAQPP